MNIVYAGLIFWTLILIASIAYLIRECLIQDKRSMRKGEMRYHVEAITKCGDSGCIFSERHFDDTLHIMEHYGVTLTEVGFNGILNNFHAEACAALRRYVETFRIRTRDEWGADVEPDEMGIIGVPSIEGWDNLNSVQMYAQARRKLKRLERQYRIFHSRTPIGGAVFLLQ